MKEETYQKIIEAHKHYKEKCLQPFPNADIRKIAPTAAEDYEFSSSFDLYQGEMVLTLFDLLNKKSFKSDEQFERKIYWHKRPFFERLLHLKKYQPLIIEDNTPTLWQEMKDYEKLRIMLVDILEELWSNRFEKDIK